LIQLSAKNDKENVFTAEYIVNKIQLIHFCRKVLSCRYMFVQFLLKIVIQTKLNVAAKTEK
jgi:hypothetical protein